MPIKLLFLYFIIGGTVVTVVTYFGSQGKNQTAAFIAFLPSTSLITLCTIYFNGGTHNAVSYARGMLILLPPWGFYVLSIIVLLPRIGLPATIFVSVAVYLILSLLAMKLA